MKSVRIWSFSGPCFLAFRLNTEYLARMQESTDLKNSEYRHFSRSEKRRKKLKEANKGINDVTKNRRL